jgi:hypothetical protein
MTTAKKATAPKADETPVDEQPTPVADRVDKDMSKNPEDVDPAGKTEAEVMAELNGADPVDVNRLSVDTGPEPAGDDTPPAAVYVEEPGKAVTMADVAALNGIGLAPDASRVNEVRASEVPFISEGVRNDLEMYGHAVDPATGRRIIRDEAE